MITVRILVFGLGLFLVVLFIAAFSVPHNSTFPILNNLLRDVNVLPFLVTALIDVFLIHLLVSLCVIKIMHKHVLIHVLLTFGTYLAIFITLFVFPFVKTSWNSDYVGYTIICFNIAWMINTLRFVKKMFAWSITSCVVYTLASLVYFVLYTFYQSEISGILAVEIASGLSLVLFLLVVSVDFFSFKLEINAEGQN